jgi:endogenous inhibitor of DNA gyrase (YacG/DUF329 family)
MGRVMFKCPTTGKPVFTGMGMDKGMLESDAVQLTHNTTGPCPHCGKDHTWSKKDVWVEE